jgi:hypothetical protein
LSVIGLVFADLAQTRGAAPSQTLEDRRTAEGWLQKSLAGWRELESDPAFAPTHPSEMQQVEKALAGIRR